MIHRKLFKMAKHKNAIVNAAAVTPHTSTEVNFGMDIDLRLNKDDLANLVSSQAEENLVVDREKGEQKLKKAMAAHAEAVKKLDALAQQLLAGYVTDDETRELLRHLQVWTQNAYTVEIVSKSASYYSKPEEKEPTIDGRKMMITGSAQIKQKSDKHSSILLSRDVSIPFTNAMREAMTDIEAKAVVVRDVQDELGRTSRLINDIPRLRSRALRELTIGIAKGQVKTMADAVNIVMGTQSMALPGTPMTPESRQLTVNQTVNVSTDNDD
jgi:hypothetical protein